MLAVARPNIRCTALTLAPDDTAKDATVCRRSCGVIDGKVSSAFWRFVTGSWNTRAPVAITQRPAAHVSEHQRVTVLIDHQRRQLVSQHRREWHAQVTAASGRRRPG